MPGVNADAKPLPPDWWGTGDVLRYCREHGVIVPRGTWASLVSRGKAPTADPEGKIGNYPRWRPETIRVWFAARYPGHV